MFNLIAAGSGRENFVDITVPWWGWEMLLGVIGALLLFDILVVHRRPHVAHVKEAAIESAVWVGIGVGFTFVIWWMFERAAAVEYISGYLIEKSLSVDNVFVWAMIFTHFKVPREYQHRTLFWGIFGALVMRFVFIFLGVAIIERFDYVLIGFGLFLIYTGVGVFRHGGEDDANPS
ncbi:MAG: tellurium resistance protein TerC, partial [Actinobacteria bacterium]|nr:tellurium resistance protein TerC [Actinomycetota bacterium]